MNDFRAGVLYLYEKMKLYACFSAADFMVYVELWEGGCVLGVCEAVCCMGVGPGLWGGRVGRLFGRRGWGGWMECVVGVGDGFPVRGLSSRFGVGAWRRLGRRDAADRGGWGRLMGLFGGWDGCQWVNVSSGTGPPRWPHTEGC